jgi:Cathepsin propeptide inhibitor domain (I29)
MAGYKNLFKLRFNHLFAFLLEALAQSLKVEMKVLFFVLVATQLALAFNAPYQREIEAFRRFKIDFKKTYPSLMKEVSALMRFITTLHQIEEHNRLYEEGLFDFYATLNQMADLSEEEKKVIITGNRVPSVEFSDFSVRPKELISVNTTMFPPGPASVDWRAAGHVTPVKDQGNDP